MSDRPLREVSGCRCCRRYGIERPATADDGLCDGCRDNCTEAAR